jgi:CRISPR/Cas system-associated exonuclease Cas4 (RecB family)
MGIYGDKPNLYIQERRKEGILTEGAIFSKPSNLETSTYSLILRNTQISCTEPIALVGIPDGVYKNFQNNEIIIHEHKDRKSLREYESDWLQISIYRYILRHGEYQIGDSFIRGLLVVSKHGNTNIKKRFSSILRDDHYIEKMYHHYQRLINQEAAPRYTKYPNLCRHCGFTEKCANPKKINSSQPSDFSKSPQQNNTFRNKHPNKISNRKKFFYLLCFFIFGYFLYTTTITSTTNNSVNNKVILNSHRTAMLKSKTSTHRHFISQHHATHLHKFKVGDCETYKSAIRVEGLPYQSSGRACLESDKKWHIIS